MTPAMRGHLAMLLFSGLVAGSFSLGALAANEIAPVALVTFRFVFATILIGIVTFLTVGVPVTAAKGAWRYLMLGGLFAVYFVLMFEGLKTAPPVSAASVFTLTPIMAAIFGWLLLRQVAGLQTALALFIGMAGAIWVIFRADVGQILNFNIGRGEAIFFVGCGAHALYTPLVRKLNRGEHPLVSTFGTLVGGSLLLIIFGWQELWATSWAELPPIVWVTITYTTIFATAVTFYLVQYAALRLPSAKVMAYTYLTPSWVILWEILLGNSAPHGLVLAGVALTIVALLMLLKETTHSEPASRRPVTRPS